MKCLDEHSHADGHVSTDTGSSSHQVSLLMVCQNSNGARQKTIKRMLLDNIHFHTSISINLV